MMSLDPIICQMKESECDDCHCEDAASDIDDQDVRKWQKVTIYGSFCYPVKGHSHIAIIVKDFESGQEVWSKVCDTGAMCTIPFTSEDGFICS